MATYKTLVVSPQTNLEYAPDEVMSVVNLLNAKMLSGRRATFAGLVDTLAEGWDRIWISTHGNEKGIWLTNSETEGPANASELTTLIRACGACLAVLNTCSSYEVARAIFREVRCDFVCTVTPLPDRMAFVTGTVFAQKLAEGFDPYDAYELAKPGNNTTYEFFQGRGDWLMPPNEKPQVSLPSLNDASQMADLVRRLEIILNGNASWNVEGVVPAVRALGVKVDTLMSKVEQLERNQFFNRRLLLVVSIVCVALLVAVGVQIAMQAGGAVIEIREKSQRRVWLERIAYASMIAVMTIALLFAAAAVFQAYFNDPPVKVVSLDKPPTEPLCPGDSLSINSQVTVERATILFLYISVLDGQERFNIPGTWESQGFRLHPQASTFQQHINWQVPELAPGKYNRAFAVRGHDTDEDPIVLLLSFEIAKEC